MSKGSGRYVGRDAKTGSFVVDKRYIKTQAREAVALFLAPVSGVYRSALGKPKSGPKTIIREKVR